MTRLHATTVGGLILVLACAGCPESSEFDFDGDGWTDNNDCAPEDPDIHPGAEEICDGVDNDCNDGVDEGFDADGDGVLICGADGVLDSEDDDCDDGDAGVYPGADESCDGIDNDCDGVVPPDENDGDGDGYTECEGDCDDAEESQNPDAEEVCDGIDNDCDEQVDEGLTEDGDGDGFTPCDGDCDDDDDAVGPHSIELCSDGVDNDCDGVADDTGCYACDATVPLAFGTIQAAIDGMSTGSVICVQPGTYDGPLNFNGNDVHVLAVGGATETIIDGGHTDAVVKFNNGESSDAILEGFTITNGSDINNGGGVRINGSSPVLRNLIITDNRTTGTGSKGGGVYIGGESAPLLQDVVLQSNEAGNGAGLYAEESSPVLQQVVIASNTASSYGGGLRLSDCSAELISVTLSGNHASDGGGGAALWGDSSLLSSVRVDANTSNHGGGLYLTDGCSTQLQNVRVTANESSFEAGGIRLISSSPTLTNVIVAGNTAADSGGGIATGGSGHIEAVNSAFVGNVAGGDGGGLHFEASGVASFTSVVVAHNEAAGAGGGMNNTGAAEPEFSACTLWANTPDDTNGMTSPLETGDAVATDPDFVDVEDPSPTQWDLHLGPGSELIDAGGALVTSQDPDGTSNDIGAYGGQEAASWDLDGDGWFEWWQPGPYDPLLYPAASWDCNDGDPAITPLAGCE